MHHSFFAEHGDGCRTSCGRRFAFRDRVAERVTGLDSLVTCAGCQLELARYRYDFPLASSNLAGRWVGDAYELQPEMAGGAR